MIVKKVIGSNKIHTHNLCDVYTISFIELDGDSYIVRFRKHDAIVFQLKIFRIPEFGHDCFSITIEIFDKTPKFKQTVYLIETFLVEYYRTLILEYINNKADLIEVHENFRYTF